MDFGAEFAVCNHCRFDCAVFPDLSVRRVKDSIVESKGRVNHFSVEI